MPTIQNNRRHSVFLPVCYALSTLVIACAAPSSTAAPAAPTASAAATAPKASRSIVLGDNIATIDLPANYAFVDAERAKVFMKQQGASEEGVLGIIAPKKGSADEYIVLCRFEGVGYVSDTDADKLNADEILNSYREGTKEQNEERKEQKLPPIFVGKWAEKPHYDKKAHHVVWAIEIKDEDSESAPVTGINYNTRILGRKGVLSMNLVTDPKNLERDKVKVAELLKDTTLNHGQTYAEYVPGKDKSAEYGIAGLILGGGAAAAAAKFGVFGVLWKWGLGIFLLLKKFIILGAVAVAGLFSKLFGKKKVAEPVAPTSSVTDPPDESHNSGSGS